MSAARPRPGAPHVLRRPGARSRRPGRPPAAASIALGQRRRRHVERRELLDQALDARGLGALVDAVERRQLARSRAAPATASLAAIIRCSISRCDSVWLARHERRSRGPRARSRTPARPTRSPAPRAPRARRPAPPRPRARRRAAPAHGASARSLRRRRCGRPAGSPGARPSGSASGGTRVRTTSRRSRSSSTVTASRSWCGHERAGLVGERLGQHRLDLAGDVDARAAPVGLAVDRASPAARARRRRRCGPRRARARRPAARRRSRRRSRARSAGRS